MPSKGTTNLPIRFTAPDREKITAIQERFGLPSQAAAVRYAVESTHRQIDPPKKLRKIPD